MAKLNSTTSRQPSALADDFVDADDEAFLRPVAAPAQQGRAGRGAGARAERSRVLNRDPAEEAEAFLRARRRVDPRQSRLRTLLHSRLGRVLLAIALIAVFVALGAAAWAVRSFLQHDPHFRIDSSTSIEASGNNELSREEIVDVFGSDIGRNVFFVPLLKRQAALEALPWVRHATVMRLLPKALRVTIEERVPVAFVRVGRQIELVDGDGVLLSMAPATLAARHYSFPVVVGLDPNGPPEARAARMRLFQTFEAALDAGGGKVTSQLSEVDVADLDDVRAVVPAQGTDMLLHFGNSDFLERWRSYQEHLPEWRQQYPNLSAVDLRYDRQVVLKMADAAQADETAEEKAQAAAEVKPAVAASNPSHHAPATAHAGVARAESRGFAKPRNAASAHAAKPGRTWYTETRTGPHHAIQWVPHTLPPSSGATSGGAR